MNIEAFFRMTYGLYIISAEHNKKKNGLIANSVFQVTAEPPQIAFSSNKKNFTTSLIKESKKFSISVLEQGADIELISRFGYKSGRDIDKFTGINYKALETGAPVVVENSIAFFECVVKNEVDLGTHVMFIGEVINADILDDKKIPITYAYYREVKKGFAPENAPTYIDKTKLKYKKESDDKMNEKYVCGVCGYIYDPAVGDEVGGIKPNTPFEDLPDDWVCPVCGAAKDEFEKE